MKSNIISLIAIAGLALCSIYCGKQDITSPDTSEGYQIQPLLKLSRNLSINEVASAKAVVTGSSIDDSLTFTLIVDRTNVKLKGILTIPKQTTSCQVTIYLYDSLDRKIGQGEYSLTATDFEAGICVTPVIGMESAKPRITIDGPDTVGINDYINLSATAADSFGGSIIMYELQYGSSTWIETDSAHIGFAAPDSGQVLACSLRVTDNDGNVVSICLLVSIEIRAPTAHAGNDTTVSINDTVNLIGSGSSDESAIIEYAWKCGTGNWIAVGDGDTNILAPSTVQQWVCSLRVTDDDSNTAFSAKIISVENRPPIAVAGNDTTVGINDAINLHGSGSTDETSIVEYAWKCENANWIVDDDGDTSIVAPSTVQQWVCSLRVTDDDSNTAFSAKIISVENRPPIAVAGNDTTVGINDAINLHGSGSTDETSIVEYAWKCGSGNWLVDGDGDTTVTAPATAQQWPCSLRVTDDDGNVDYDTVTVTVETRAPVANAGTDTAVFVNEFVNLRKNGSTDETAIAGYMWKFGSGNWIPVSTGDTTVMVPVTEQTWVCSLQVADNEGNFGYDAATITTVGTTLSDIDGNIYNVVRIGGQFWTVENLRTTKYNDGISIPNVADSASWVALTTGAYCFYDTTTNAVLQEKYGALYNWHAVNTDKLAPTGWHVPTDEEWTVLENYLIASGHNYNGSTTENKIAKSMAAKSDWETSAIAGSPGYDLSLNNSCGFTALPGGYRGSDGNFSYQGSYDCWWSSTESDASYAYSRNLYSGSASLDKYSYSLKHLGFSVRLVRDWN